MICWSLLACVVLFLVTFQSLIFFLFAMERREPGITSSLDNRNVWLLFFFFCTLGMSSATLNIPNLDHQFLDRQSQCKTLNCSKSKAYLLARAFLQSRKTKLNTDSVTNEMKRQNRALYHTLVFSRFFQYMSARISVMSPGLQTKLSY